MFRVQMNKELWPSNYYVIIQKLRNAFRQRWGQNLPHPGTPRVNGGKLKQYEFINQNFSADI